ncbi:unnamed protein product [Cercopithifilaria johnstoni]|uniref:Uncharacterized protein n=1 Tax=Cercopithifilaria johnstoni TaxID=2874296 RepID=A0A8J2PRP9_9BILA|nr:unnamed protein product [Cercopithifilaria johnstoni]
MPDWWRDRTLGRAVTREKVKMEEEEEEEEGEEEDRTIVAVSIKSRGKKPDISHPVSIRIWNGWTKREPLLAHTQWH